MNISISEVVMQLAGFVVLIIQTKEHKLYALGSRKSPLVSFNITS